MALEIVGQTGQHGQIIISDEREDGALILLVCEEYQGGGALVRPDEDEAPPGGGGLPWPTTARRQLGGPAQLTQPFEFTLNIEGMPRGLNRFSFEDLSTSVLDAVNRGTTSATINAANASSWGWLGPAVSTT